MFLKEQTFWYNKLLKDMKFSKFSDIPLGDKKPLNSRFEVSWSAIYRSDYKSVISIEEILRKYAIAGPIMVNPKSCVICRTYNNVQTYCIKLFKNKSLKYLMISNEHKTIFLCKKHYLLACRESFKSV